MKKLCYNCMKAYENAAVCPHCRCTEQSARAPYHIPPGSIIGGRYIIGRSLGEGGFGITYIGFDERLNRRVAVKEYYPSGTANRSGGNGVIVTQGKRNFFERGKQNFIREARAVAKFTNEEGIVDVYDSFEENNTAYIIMEYLEGINLKQYLLRSGLMNEARLISLMTPVMKSLNAMHQSGIIHRDISPDNIMYTSSGKLKLMDFGSARYFANEEKELSVILKHGYAPEEQYRSNGRQGPYTDVYSMCATIYACITGRPPADSIERLVNDRVQTPSQLGIRITPEHERALMHGLAVSASERCPDMQTLIDEFSGRFQEGTRTVSANVPYDYQNNYGGYNQGGQNYNGNQYSYSDNYNGGYNYQYRQNQQNPPKKGNGAIIAAIIISSVVIIGLVAAIIYLLNDNGGNEKTEEPSEQTTTVSEIEDNNASQLETAPPVTDPGSPDFGDVEVPTDPQTSQRTAKHSYSPGSVSGLSHDEVNKICQDTIQPVYTATMETDTNGYLDDSRYIRHGNYSIFNSHSGTYRIITPADNYGDGKTDRTWYYFDSDDNLVFIFAFENHHQYRYYVYNDRVIKLDYRSGDSDTRDDATVYFYDESGMPSNTDSIVSTAYSARDYVFAN